MSFLVPTRVKVNLVQPHSWPLHAHDVLSGFQDICRHVPDIFILITRFLQRDYPRPVEAIESLIDVLLDQVCQPWWASLPFPVSIIFIILLSEKIWPEFSNFVEHGRNLCFALEFNIELVV